MTATVYLKLQGPMDHLRLVWQMGETLLDSVPFEDDPEGTRYNVLLSIQELLTNVIRYGHGGDESQPIELRMQASDSEFVVELKDRGERFDPVAYEGSTPGDDVPPTESGGYGIVIVKMVMDEFEYEFVDGMNVVRATKSVCSMVPVAASQQQS